jgi:hypothetical protein
LILSSHTHPGKCCGHSHSHGARLAEPKSAAAAAAPKPPSNQMTTPQDETFNYNPQDRMVFASGTKVIPGVGFGSHGPATADVMLHDKLEKHEGTYAYPDGDARQNSSLAFANAAHAVSVFKEVFGDQIKWAFEFDKLLVRPNCGKDLNANYKRESGTVNFYMDTDPVTKASVHSGASADIVAHEVGHALLDAIRPEYFSSWGPEPSAFHEAFGDMMSIHMALKDPAVLAKAVEQTGGDLSKPNVVADLAEQLGTAVNNQEGKNKTGGNYLRNANNQLKFADPSKLASEKGGPDELGWGKHSLSRVWTGAHFDLLKAIVRERMDAGAAPDVALRESNEEVFKMLATMLKESPRGKFGFKDMAISFIQSDKLHNGGKRADLIQKVFTERNILPADLPAEMLEKDVESRRARTASLFQSASAEPGFQATQVVLGPELGQFAGAVVDVPVSDEERLFKSEHVQSETERDIARLVKAGKIRYNDPAYRMKPEDHYNPQREVYEGAVVWEDGKMKIERLHISC